MTGSDFQPHLFCFGLGYSCTHLAKKLLAEGWRVSGTHRSMEACDADRIHGITSYLFDNDMPLAHIWDMYSITHLLISIPPDEQGDQVLRLHQQDMINLPNLKWVGYLSTTGVYGDYQGAWVDESSELKPATSRTQWRVQAEQAWLETALPVHIFRLAGIYGPGRSVLDSLQAGTAKRIDKPEQYFSRIHVADITKTLTASMMHPNPPAIYNVCDDLPAPQADVMTYGATLLGMTPPPLVALSDASLSEMARSFYAQNRRVKNNKIKQSLGITLTYPTYKEGLAAIASI